MASLKAQEALVEALRQSVAALEAGLAEERERLAEAEAGLEAERSRLPEVGEFARSTLTHFYGRITRVTPRPGGRAWVEINPYLTPTMPGRSTLDLFEAWELIDDPAGDGAPEPGAEPTGVEIVTQLTQNLAMARPATLPAASTPSLSAPSGSAPALPAPDESAGAHPAHGPT